ncbi:MAG: flagellar hook-length control protein FliK [Minwuiales bacterium]|nr:flagellar hook-length control protein FliK [Minwuiales bacterium]
MSRIDERGPTFPNADRASTSDDDRRSAGGKGKPDSASDDRLSDAGKRFRELAGSQHSDETTAEGREEPVRPLPGGDRAALPGASVSPRRDQLRAGDGRAEFQTSRTDTEENEIRPTTGHPMPSRPTNRSAGDEAHIPATRGTAFKEQDAARSGDGDPLERPVESPPLQANIQRSGGKRTDTAEVPAVPAQPPIDEGARVPVDKGHAARGQAMPRQDTLPPAERQPVRDDALYGAHPNRSESDEMLPSQTNLGQTDDDGAVRNPSPASDMSPPLTAHPAGKDVPTQAGGEGVASGGVQLRAQENPGMSTERPSSPADGDLGARESAASETPMRPASRPGSELHLSAGERHAAGDPPATQQPPGSDGSAGRSSTFPSREGHPYPPGSASGTGPRPPLQSGTDVRLPDAPLAQSRPSAVLGAHDIEKADHPRVHPETAPSARPLTGDRVLQGLHAVPDQPTTAAAQAEGPDTHLSEIVQKLVDRILVSEPKSGQPEVRIMLNTATLEGTEITLSRDANGLSVRFQTPSPEVAQRLNEAQNALQQTLEHNKAEPVRIEIEARREGGAQDRGNDRSRNRRDLREEQKNRE